MFNLIVESIVVAFCVGGVMGAVVTMHLMHPKKAMEKKPEEVLEP